MNLTPNNEDRYKYKMRYKYDEAGNRIRKMMYRSRLGEENWTLYNDEVYIRDAKGNETAMYENSNLQYINILGAGLEGKVRKDDRGNTIYSYYYKDHLGSITAVMNGASGTITQAQDYDAWGDICRTYSTGWAMNIFHELEHNETGIGDPEQYGIIGDVEKKLNIMRDEMDLEPRTSYKSKNGYLPFDLQTEFHLENYNIPDENMKYIKMY